MGVVGRVAVCVAVFATLVFGLLLADSPAVAQSAILETLARRVTLAREGSSSDVTVERVIQSGDRVSTDSGGRAVVTYPDGSTALLEENSELVIEFVHTSANDYVVRMEQTLGRVWYAVTRAMNAGSRYEVHSPGMASVIRAGSDSYVTVSPSGSTTVVTVSGAVDATAGGAEVTVAAGTSTTIVAGATPPAPQPAPPVTPPSSGATTPPPAPPSLPQTQSSPAPTSAYVPPAATLPPLPVMTAATRVATPKPTPLATPKPAAAPAPSATPLKDQFGPRKDAPGQPPPKTTLLK